MNSPGRRSRQWPAYAVIACLPIAVAVVRFLARSAGGGFGDGGLVLDGDEAVFALQTADAATGGFPTAGLYSWNGWNHPGPIAFYLFVPFHWISGGSPWGMFLGAAAWSVATVWLTAWLAHRRGGTALVAALLAGQLGTFVAVGGAGTIDPWTPNLAVALVIPFLLGCWGLLAGDDRAAAVAIVLALVAPQIHVGYAALFGVVAVITAAVSLGRGLRRWRVWAMAAGIGAFTWLPVGFDLLTGRTGNLRRLVDYFLAGTPEPAGIGEGLRIIAGEASPWPTWISGPRPQGLFLEARPAAAWWFALLVGLVVAALIWRWSRGGGGLIVALAGLVAGALASSQLRGSRFHYLVYWRAPLVLFALVVTARAAGGYLDSLPSPLLSPLLTRRSDRVRSSRRGPVLAGTVFAAMVLNAGWQAGRADRVTRYGDVLAELLPAARSGAPTDGRLLLRLGDGGVVGVLPGVLHDLSRRGIDVGVDADLEWVVGDRGIDPETADEVWYVTDNGWSLSLLTATPDARLVAARTPYSSPDELRVVSLHRTLAEQLRAAGRADAMRSLDSPLVGFALGDIPGVDQVLVAELATLNADMRPGDRLGIVGVPPDVAPVIDWPLTAL